MSAKRIAAKGIIGLNNPHLPKTHDDITNWAQKVGCSVETVIKHCLYDHGEYQIELSLNKAGVKRVLNVIPGHLLYEDKRMRTQGPAPAKIMIIGKNVGMDDVSKRRLYAGDMGEVLTEGLKSAGFSAGDISKMYLATVLATEPLDSGKSTLPPLWVDSQRMILMQQILLVRPSFCLLQGSEAVKAVLGKNESIAMLEGKVIEKTYNCSDDPEVEDLHTIKFVVSVSPGAVIHDRSHPSRDPKFKTAAETRLLKQLAYFKSIVDGKEQVSVSDTFSYDVLENTEQLEEALKIMRAKCKNRLVAWDAEWQGAHPESEGYYLRCIQFAYRGDHAYVIALTQPGGDPRFKRRDENGNWTTDGANDEAARLCKQYMKGLRVVGHYFIADLERLIPFGLDLREEFDAAEDHTKVFTEGGVATELAAHARDETALFSLDDQIALHTNFPKYSLDLTTFKKAAKQQSYVDHKNALQPYRTAKSELRAARRDLRDATIKYANVPYQVKRERLGNRRRKLIRATAVFAIENDRKQQIDEEQLKYKHMMADGYGWIPDDKLYPYAAYDAAAELVLGEIYLEYLKADRFGNDCTKAYWISHRAAFAALEINRTGMRVDRAVLDDLSVAFLRKRDQLLQEIRDYFNWQDFNPRSKFEFAEVLFGEEFNGYMQQYGTIRRHRPEGAKTLRAEPLRTTGKYPMEWSKVREEGRVELASANTSKQTLGEMFYSADKLTVREKDPLTGQWHYTTKDYSKPIGLLRSYRYMDQALKSLMRQPNLDAQGEVETDEDGNADYEAGISTLICRDGKVRTTIRQTVETGRWASSNPALQNLMKSREADFAKIFGTDRNVSVRSIFKPDDRIHDPYGNEDWFLVEADLSGAELMITAIMSQDDKMIEHCQRNLLPSKHPDFFDIHSNLTVQAFKLTCEPTKKGLESVGMEHLRTVGKSVVFGSLYGRSARAIAIAVRQEGVFVTEEEAAALQHAFFAEYSQLGPFFAACRERVKVGWLCNMFGRYRRFPVTNDEAKRRAYEREAMNATIQGGVADAMSYACRNLIDYRDQHQMRYRLCLQIHDAVMLHVPASELAHVIDPDDGVLKRCMIKMIPLRPCDLDGNELPGAETYHFGSSIDVYDHWGQAAHASRFINNGLSPALGGWEFSDGVWTHPEFEDGWRESNECLALAS